MKTHRTQSVALAALILSTLNPQLSTLLAQGTAFTYQGRLNSGGAPANGTYDLLFTIYDLPTGPGAIANQTNAAVAISNGLFTVTLDFVPGIFTGPERWLEIAVRTNGGGSYSNLVPRQKITATPYAITASNLSGSISSSQLNGTIPLAQLPATVVTNNQSGVNISGTFSGNGGSLSNLNSLNLAGPLTVAADPVSLGHIDDGGFAHGVAVSGNFAFLANEFDGLRVYNIANPANPVSIGHTNDGGNASGVAVSGNFAFLANQFDGLRVYNIVNPTNPVSIGHIYDGGNASGVAVSGNFAFLANGLEGLRVYNIADPTNLVSIGHIDDGGFALGVAVSGNFAYLANYDDGLRVYNIANPTNPVSIGHSYDGAFAHGVAVSGNFAFLANEFDGLRVYNIANPTNPVSIGHTNDGGLARGVAVSGNFAYLANHLDGLRVYNIANPTNPASIGHIYDGGEARGVAVSGNFAYLANREDGLRVYGLGVASAPAFRGDGSLLTGLNTDINADNITSGTLNAARIPNLDASKITTGTLGTAQIPNLDASKITTGTLGTAQIPNLDASKITTGTIADARLSANVAVLNRNGQVFTGSNSFSHVTINPPATLSFGAGTRQMLNLWNTQYGIGVQSYRVYFRTDVGGGFAWFMGGTHNDVSDNPGAGGTQLMKLDESGNLSVRGVVATNIALSSDRTAKENFSAVNSRKILDKVAALPISEWNFKGDEGTRHIGPMAQDFYAAFNVGPDDKHIAVVDEGGVALAAIQGLNQKLTEELKQKATEITELKQRLEALEQVIHHQKTK